MNAIPSDTIELLMQRLRGDGIALVHAGGAMMYRELGAGEQLKIDTGCIMALSASVQYDIQFIGGVKNTLFGGEGPVARAVFWTTLWPIAHSGVSTWKHPVFLRYSSECGFTTHSRVFFAF